MASGGVAAGRAGRAGLRRRATPPVRRRGPVDGRGRTGRAVRVQTASHELNLSHQRNRPIVLPGKRSAGSENHTRDTRGGTAEESPVESAPNAADGRTDRRAGELAVARPVAVRDADRPGWRPGVGQIDYRHRPRRAVDGRPAVPRHGVPGSASDGGLAAKLTAVGLIPSRVLRTVAKFLAEWHAAKKAAGYKPTSLSPLPRSTGNVRRGSGGGAVRGRYSRLPGCWRPHPPAPSP